MPATQGDILIKVQSTEVNMVMKFIYKDAMDGPTVLIMRYVI